MDRKQYDIDVEQIIEAATPAVGLIPPFHIPINIGEHRGFAYYLITENYQDDTIEDFNNLRYPKSC